MNDLLHEYRVLFDNMAQGAFFQLADGSLVDVNAAALEMFGVTRDQFMGRTSMHPEWHVVTEDGRPLAPQQHPSMAALCSGLPVRDFVAGVYNPQKKAVVWLNINAIPMFRDRETSPYKVFVTLHDVTEQKRINDLHLSRIHLMQFSHGRSLEAVLVEALDQIERLTGSEIGFYHFFNRKTRSVTLKAWSTRTSTLHCGMQSKEGGHYGIDQAGVWAECALTGLPAIHNDYGSLPNRRGLPEGHAALTRELVVPVLRDGEVVAIAGVGNKATGYTEADVRAASLLADFTWDIAGRKQAENDLLRKKKELKTANEQLESRVNQRTADLQAAIREQESFSYSVSHDLRAPLRHVNSYSTLLLEEFGSQLPPEACGYLDRIKAASSRMGTLIDHLLELSRVARSEMKAVEVDLGRMAASILDMLRETDRHRQVVWRIEPGLVAIGDDLLLGQLLGNLLENSWKYTSGKPAACIEFGKTVAGGEEAFFVKDDGAGFDMRYSDNIFKPFERLHGAEFDGIGIGLATAQRIVHRHGGRIWAEGEVGRGACVYFTLHKPPTPPGPPTEG